MLRKVQAIVATEPLSPVGSSPTDLGPVPANHMVLKANQNLPPVRFNKDDVHSIKYMADIFWRPWLKEYLPILKERAKQTRPNVGIGSLELIVD